MCPTGSVLERSPVVLVRKGPCEEMHWGQGRVRSKGWRQRVVDKVVVGMTAYLDNASVETLPALMMMFDLHVTIHEHMKLGSTHTALC